MGQNMRKACSQRLLAILKTITPANGYVKDLSAAGVVERLHETPQQLRDLALPISVRLSTSAEASSPQGAHKQPMHTTLAFRLTVLVRRLDGTSEIDDLLDDVIGDLRRAVDTHDYLQLGAAAGITDRAWVATITEPNYDFNEQLASCDLVLSLSFDYVQGQDF